MVWSSPADGDVFLGRDAADLCGVQNLPERGIVQTCEEFRFHQRSRTGRGTGHVLESERIRSDQLQEKNLTVLKLASQ